MKENRKLVWKKAKKFYKDRIAKLEEMLPQNLLEKYNNHKVSDFDIHAIATQIKEYMFDNSKLASISDVVLDKAIKLQLEAESVFTKIIAMLYYFDKKDISEISLLTGYEESIICSCITRLLRKIDYRLTRNNVSIC